MTDERTCERGVVGRSSGGLRNDDDIEAMEHCLMEPKGFSDLPLDPIAGDRLGRHPPRYCNPDAWDTVILPRVHQEHLISCFQAAVSDGAELGRTA